MAACALHRPRRRRLGRFHRVGPGSSSCEVRRESSHKGIPRTCGVDRNHLVRWIVAALTRGVEGTSRRPQRHRDGRHPQPSDSAPASRRRERPAVGATAKAPGPRLSLGTSTST